MTVYLLHFQTKYHHAGHYLGSTNSLKKRLAEHKSGHGARLMAVVSDAGIGFELARTWDGGRTLEKKLKQQKNGKRLCPICQKTEAQQ